MPNGHIIATECSVPVRYINARNPLHPDRRDFDYGIIKLPAAFDGISRFMRVRALNDDEMRRLKRFGLITIAGYPADRPEGTLWRHTERLKRITPGRLLYTVDTCPGHSGSPVWYRYGNRRTIIGVHTSGVLDEMGRPYGCMRGTVLAPPGMMNSGVRITPRVLADVRNPDRIEAGERRMARFP